METNIFEYATRRKLRFSMNRGIIMTEDLWDLNLESLNTLAKSLNKKIKESEEEDFIGKKKSGPKSYQEKDLEAQFEIVKHVIKVKLDEQEKRKESMAKAETLRRLRDKLAAAQDRDLDSKSADELKKMIEDLEKES